MHKSRCNSSFTIKFGFKIVYTQNIFIETTLTTNTTYQHQPLTPPSSNSSPTQSPPPLTSLHPSPPPPQYGAQTDIIEPATGLTPLHIACRGGHLQGVKLLIEAGCDVEVESKYDHLKPLYLAIRHSKDGAVTGEIVDCLLNEGASANITGCLRKIQLVFQRLFMKLIEGFIECFVHFVLFITLNIIINLNFIINSKKNVYVN